MDSCSGSTSVYLMGRLDNHKDKSFYEGTRKVFQFHNTDIDGVFAGDDILASIVYNYAVQHQITVLERLKIIGFDGTEAIHTIFPALTTIQQPIEFLAEKSVRLLLSLIREERVPPVTTLPVDLYRGGTV